MAGERLPTTANARSLRVAPVPPASDAVWLTCRQHRAFKLAVRLEGGKPRVSRVQAQLRLRGKQTDRFHVQVCSLILQWGTTFCYGSCSVGLKHHRGPNQLQPRHSPTDDRIALGSECRISQVGQWTENRMTFPKLCANDYCFPIDIPLVVIFFAN